MCNLSSNFEDAVQSLYSRSWLISVFSMTEQTTESRVGLMSVASWSEINTYIHLVSRSEQRCSCPCSLISSRNSSRLSDKLWFNRNITQNSWIQCLGGGSGRHHVTDTEDTIKVRLLKCVRRLNWPDEEAYPLALCRLLVVQSYFKCKGLG